MASARQICQPGLRATKMTAEFFAQSSEAANVDLWPVRSSSRALPGGAKGAFTMAVLRRRAAGRSDDVFAQRSLRLATSNLRGV